MATKTIVATVTLHVPGPTFKPFTFSDTGNRRGGKYDVTEAVPGTPVAVDETEADALIALGKAKVYVAPTTTAAPALAPASPPAPPAK